MKATNFTGIKHFEPYEFFSPDIDGGAENMDRKLLIQLDSAREMYGKPMKINSGFRTKAHNKKVGGSDTSSHMGGYAVDIHVPNGYERLHMVDALLRAGFKRIGVANTFIHVDTDYKKPNSLWIY